MADSNLKLPFESSKLPESGPLCPDRIVETICIYIYIYIYMFIYSFIYWP